MSDATTFLLGGIITILASGGVATIVVRYMERRKTVAETNHTNAQATDVLVQAGEKAVKILTEQLDRAMERIDALERAGIVKDLRIAELEGHVERLEILVDELRSQE